MALPSSGKISIGDMCDEADVYKDGVTFPSTSRASHSRFQNDVSCKSHANPLRNSDYYGYIHPIVELVSSSFVSQTFTRYTFKVTVTVTTDNPNRDRPLVLRIRQTYGTATTSFSVVTGSATVPDLVDPDSVVFGSGTSANAESVVFTLPVGTSTASFNVTVPKIASTYDQLIDLIRTKGQVTDDKYKIVNNVNTNPLGGSSGIDRLTVTVPAAPLLYSWESTAEGGLEANPCNPLLYATNAYLFKDSGTTLQVGDEVFSNNDLNNLIPFQQGSYGFRRNGVKYDVSIVTTAGIISSVTACP